MEKISINSKVLVTPKASVKAFKIALHICLAICIIINLFIMLFDGVSLGNIGSVALAFVIVEEYVSRPANKIHYEYALAEVTCDNNLNIIYKNVNGKEQNDIIVQIPKSNITTMEYRLQKLHIVGN